MKKNFTPRFIGSAAASCILGLVATQQSSAAVSDDDFNSLKSMVQQLQQAHQQDQQQIQTLQQQLGETHDLATNAVAQADAVAQIQATPVRSALHNFTMVGDAEIQYAKTYGNGTHNGFMLADFAPIFLYQANQSILFEGGFDIMVNNGSASGTNSFRGQPGQSYTHDSGSSTSVSMSFGQLDYIINDYAMFVGGYMLLPLGTYSERGAGFLNKIPDSPLGVDLLPGAGAGAQLRGAYPVGDAGQMLTYSVYGVNGPSSADGSGNAYSLDGTGAPLSNLDLGGNVGLQNNGNTGNLHSAPSGGGRLGWFIPWGGAHKDLELGVSGQSGYWDDAGKYTWNAVVVDGALHVGPNFELKGEYIDTWYDTADAGKVRPWGLWAQAGYKLAGLDLDFPVISDIELVGRFDKENNGLGTGFGANLGAETRRYTLGYVYYITNTLLFEGDYEFIHSSVAGASPLTANELIFQLSYGF